MLIKMIRQVLFITTVGFGICLLFFVIVCTWIGYEVKDQCSMAQRSYDGDCVMALTSLVQDESQPYKARNQSIWALGQLGDIRALPVLHTMYTGSIPDREPLDQMISQYELKKAVNLANGGTNITAIFWRYNVD